MDINQLSSFSKLSVGDKRKHLYAIYVIEELLLKGSITIVNAEFNIYNLDIGYLDTFDTRLYNKMQSKTAGAASAEPEFQCRQIPKTQVVEVVPETPSKKARKPRAKKTDEEEDVNLPMNIPIIAEVPIIEEMVPETPSKKARKPREKKVEVVDENGVPETPSKKARKPREKKAEDEEVENGVPETPSKKGRKPRAKNTGELEIIPEERVLTPKECDVQPVEQKNEKTIADKIVDCIPDTKGKKKPADKPPKTPSKKNNKAESIAEPIVERPLTPELVEEDLPTISIVEAETEDGTTVTYLLDEKTKKIYNADDHKLKTQIGMLSEAGDLELFE